MPESSVEQARKTPAPTTAGDLTRAGALLFITGISAFGLLIYSVRDVIHPFLLCALVFGVLYPIRRDRYVKPVIAAAIVLSLVWGFYDVIGVLVPFIISFVFAYILDPLVTASERYVRRWVSSLIVILVILGFFVIVGIYVLPPLFDQLGAMVHNLSALMKSAAQWIKRGGLTNLLDGFHVPRESVRAFLHDQVSPRLQGLLQETLNGALTFVSNASAVFGQVVNAIIVPIIGFYLLKDFPGLRTSVRRFTDRVNTSNYLTGVVRDIDGLLSSYLRGQAIVALIIAALAICLFLTFGIPYAFVLGLMIFVFDFVPFVGLIASLLVSLLVVLFGDAPALSSMITVVAIVLVLHATETYFIAPHVIGKKLRLHPVIVILSLFVAARLMGFFGMLIAVPSAAVLTYLLRQWIAKADRNIIQGIAEQTGGAG